MYFAACVHMWPRARERGCSSIPYWRFGSAHRSRLMGAWGPHLEHQVAEWGVDRMAVTGNAGAQRTTLCASPAAYVGQTSFKYSLGLGLGFFCRAQSWLICFYIGNKWKGQVKSRRSQNRNLEAFVHVSWALMC